jgi:hypothetical protein
MYLLPLGDNTVFRLKFALCTNPVYTCIMPIHGSSVHTVYGVFHTVSPQASQQLLRVNRT